MNYALALHQLHHVDILLFVAVVAFQDTLFLVDDMEDGGHGLIIGDTFGVVALDDTLQHVGCLNTFFLYHLIILDDVQYYIGGYYRQLGYLIVGEKLVLHLDDTFLSYQQIGRASCRERV